MRGAASHTVDRTWSTRGFERTAAITQTLDDALFVRLMRIDAAVYFITDGPLGPDRFDIPAALVSRLGHLLFDAAWLAIAHEAEIDEAMLRTSLECEGTRLWVRFSRRHGSLRVTLLGSWPDDVPSSLPLYPLEAFALAFLLWREAGELAVADAPPIAEAA